MVGAKKHKSLTFLGIGAMLAFFYLPIVVMIVFSFNDSRSLTTFSGFSMRWYETLFKDRLMMSAVQTTLSIALISTVISTIVGTLTAIGLSGSKLILKRIVLTINNLPIMNPEVVTAISLMILFTA